MAKAETETDAAEPEAASIAQTNVVTGLVRGLLEPPKDHRISAHKLWDCKPNNTSYYRVNVWGDGDRMYAGSLVVQSFFVVLDNGSTTKRPEIIRSNPTLIGV